MPARSRRAAPSPTCSCAAIPPAGVVAASGGNHGAAVAYAAMRLGVPARIFVPTVSSPAKIDRIRCVRRRPDGRRRALRRGAGRERSSGRRAPARCRCTRSTRPKRCSARARSACELSTQAPRPRHAARRRRRRRPDRRHRRLVRRSRRASSASSPRARRRCPRRSRPAGRSTRRPAASPPIRSRRGRSAS